MILAPDSWGYSIVQSARHVFTMFVYAILSDFCSILKRGKVTPVDSACEGREKNTMTTWQLITQSLHPWLQCYFSTKTRRPYLEWNKFILFFQKGIIYPLLRHDMGSHYWDLCKLLNSMGHLYQSYLVVSWNRGTPSHHPFLDGIFHCTPPWPWNPHMHQIINETFRILKWRYCTI